MEQKNLISIIMPSYNVGKYIKTMLESIFNQTYKNYELIIVNDGSTDNTFLTILKTCENKNNVKIINQENKGVSYARNVGIKNSKGKYICFVDSDDYLNSNYLETLLKTIETTKADVAICKNTHFIKKISYLSKKNFKFNKIKIIDGSDELASQFLSSKTFNYAPWNKIYKRDVLKKMNNYPNVFIEDCYFLEDVPFGTEYFSLCSRAAFINIKLYNYRLSTTSSSHNAFNLKKISALKAHDYYKTISKTNYPQLQTYIKIKYCIDSLEILFRARKSKNLSSTIINKLYNKYKSNLKYCVKGKKCQWYRKYLMWMSKPFVFLIYRNLLKNNTNN